MNGAIAANWPIVSLIVLAIVGVPLWMTLRHRHAAPDCSQAPADYRAQQDRASSDFLTEQPATAIDGLTIVRKVGPADDADLAVPAQRHG